MRILGIETATRTGGAAIVTETGVLAAYTLNVEATHSERLMAAVDRVLSDSGTARGDIDGFAVSIGPGSFTGLRIGVSTAKGLAFTTGKPVAAVPSLRALAWNIPHAVHPVCPLFDARKGEVYAALYRHEAGGLATIMPERVLTLHELSAEAKGPTIFTGEGSLLFRDEIRSRFGERAYFAPPAATVPSAASVAEIGLGMLRSGGASDPDALTPLYIRRPEAEVAWERRYPSQ
jgi:tRNA threonylcarbamoyladenosine biosynthesis protein TsaB